MSVERVLAGDNSTSGHGAAEFEGDRRIINGRVGSGAGGYSNRAAPTLGPAGVPVLAAALALGALWRVGRRRKL